MRILVTSNCQTAGLAAALERMARLRTVRAAPIVPDEPFEAFRRRLAPEALSCDAWVVAAGPPATFARRLLDETGAGSVRLLTIPTLVFDAFHPDLTYVTVAPTGRLLEPHYNSAIAVWLFNHRVAPSAGQRLYCERVYRALGYLDRWPVSVETMRRSFQASDLAPRFEEFFLAVKRRGCFMHSVNHPTIEALGKLATLIAGALGVPLSSPLLEAELNDALNFEIWPVYPAIGDLLGVSDSGYHWRSNSGATRHDGVERYLGATFRACLRQGLRPGDLRLRGFPLPDFDARITSVAIEVFRNV